MKEIGKIYSREIKSAKKDKKYVVARKYTTLRKGKGVNSSRSVKAVDKRLKKDKKAIKRVEKESKKIGFNRGTKSKRHQRRRKGKWELKL